MEALLAVSVEPRGIHFAAYDGTSSPGELNLVGKGHIVHDGTNIEFFATSVNSSHPEIGRSTPAGGRFDHAVAMARLLGWLGRHCGPRLKAVGHRVAFGSGRDRHPPSMPVTDQMLHDAEVRMPGYEAHCLATMRYLRARFVDVLQVACFAVAESGSVLPMEAVASGGAASRAAMPADELRSIAAAALRNAEPAPISAVIHLFPTAAPPAPELEIAAAVARRA